MTATDKDMIVSIEKLLIGFPGRILLPPLTAGIRRGELVSVIGYNGVGKSTLLKTLAGVTDRMGGSISINGRDISVTGRKKMAMTIGFISTETIDVPNMTVFDLVATGRYLYTGWLGRLGEADRQTVIASMGMTGLTKLSDRYINELSDGERQRALIAKVLAQDTEILIMDEPTSFLDVRNRFEMMQLLRHLARSGEKTILLSTHDLQAAISESDKLWLLDDNGIIEGAPEDLVLNGAFDTMFADTAIRFNRHDGNFYPELTMERSITLAGYGTIRQWTARALGRLGFRVVEENTLPGSVTIICDEETLTWKVHGMSEEKAFGSLYELCRFLRHELPQRP